MAKPGHWEADLISSIARYKGNCNGDLVQNYIQRPDPWHKKNAHTHTGQRYRREATGKTVSGNMNFPVPYESANYLWKLNQDMGILMFIVKIYGQIMRHIKFFCRQRNNLPPSQSGNKMKLDT
jgi:hypothetical protein